MAVSGRIDRAKGGWCGRADRRMESVFGCPLHITHSPNQRTLYNFPMQSGGAEMLRLATERKSTDGSEASA
jgi:hypothetical protein